MIDKSLFSRPVTLPKERFDLPELGPDAYVYVSAFGSKKLEELQTIQTEKPMLWVSALLAECLVNDAGDKLFESAEECKATLNLAYPTIERLAEKILDLSGISTAKKN